MNWPSDELLPDVTPGRDLVLLFAWAVPSQPLATTAVNGEASTAAARYTFREIFGRERISRGKGDSIILSPPKEGNQCHFFCMTRRRTESFWRPESSAELLEPSENISAVVFSSLTWVFWVLMTESNLGLSLARKSRKLSYRIVGGSKWSFLNLSIDCLQLWYGSWCRPCVRCRYAKASRNIRD